MRRALAILLLVIFSSQISVSALVGGGVSTLPVTVTVGQTASLEVLIIPAAKLQKDETIRLEFSIDYAEYFAQSQFAGGGASPDCRTTFEFGLGARDGSRLDCRVIPEEKSITIKLLQAASRRAVGITIADMIMPDKVKVSDVYVDLVSSTGEKYDSSPREGGGVFSITPTAGDLRRVTLSNNNPTVGSTGQLIVTMETAHKVSGGANIRMQFPKWAGGESFVAAQGTGCSLDFGSPSNIEAGAKCRLDTLDSSYDVVIIDGAFSTDVEAGRTITFIVDEVRNYPSMRGVSGISIEVLARVPGSSPPEGYVVDQSLDGGFAPSEVAIVPADYYKLSMEATVSQSVPFTLELIVKNPCPAGTEIKIVFPPQIDARQLSSVSLVGTDQQLKTRMVTSASSTRRDTVIIEDAFKQAKRPGELTIIDFHNIIAPQSDEPTSPFKFELSEVDGAQRYPIEGNYDGVTVRARQAELTSYRLTTSTKDVLATFDAGVSVSFKGIVKRSNILNLVYPSGFQLNPQGGGGECAVSLDEGAYAGSCTVTTANRTIIIRGFATQEYDFSGRTRGGTIHIRLINMLINPPSEQPIDSGFTVHLRDSHVHNVATYDASKFASENQYSAQAINIHQFAVESQNDVTGRASKVLIRMDVREGQAFVGLQMKITLPEEVGFATLDSIRCTKQLVLDQDPECSQVQEADTRLLKVILRGKGGVTALTGPATLSFLVEDLRNPYSTAPTSSFQVQLQDSKGYKIASQNEGITLQVSQGSKFKDVAIIPASKVNGAETTYRFQVTLRNPLPPGSVLTVTAPPEVIFSPSVGSRVSCVGKDKLADRISCIWQQKEVLVTLNPLDEMRTDQVLDFSLPLVKNPPSLKRSGSFALKAEYGPGLISIENRGHEVQNTEAATITDATVSVSSNGAIASYNISFTRVNPLPDSGYIKVKFPPDVERVDGSALLCTAISDAAAPTRFDCDFSAASRELTVSPKTPLPEKIAFAVEGFKSPEAFTLQQSFEIRTFTADGARIDQVTSGVGTTSRCQRPCKSCLLDETTCTECYADSPVKYLQNNDCYRECGAGTYGSLSKDGKVLGYVCLQCAPDCETCNGTASKCTRCADPEMLLMPDGSCRGKCRDGQYADYTAASPFGLPSVGGQAARCVDCPEKCTKCASPTECYECAAGYLYHNKTCVKTCPSDMIANPDKTTCIPCKKPCLSCTGTADKCSKCDLSADSKAPFLYGSQCLAKCPDRYFGELPNSSTCQLVQEDVIPFVFFVVAFLVAMAVGIMKLCSIKVCTKKMHYKNTIIALISVVCQGNWLYVLYLAIEGSYWQSSVILLFGIGCSYVLNLVFFFLYLKVMRHDEYYDRWRQGRKLSEGVLVALALLTSFQLYRLVFQQLAQSIKLKKEEDLKREEQDVQNEGGQPVAANVAAGAGARAASGSSVHPANQEQQPPPKQYKTQDENTVKSIFNTLSIVMISCVLLPVLVQNIYSLTITHPGQKIFWEDIESLALTFCLLCMMLYDSYKKTQKVEGTRLKKPTPTLEAGRLWAGIPADLSSKQDEIRRVEDMFRSTGDIRRFREVLTLMLRSQAQAGGGDFGDEDSIDAGQMGQNVNIGKLRQHFKAGRLRNLDNAGAQGQARNRQLEMTGTSHRHEQTDNSLVTEENLLGTSDRLLFKKTLDGEDLFGVSGRAVFRQEKGARGEVRSGDDVDEDEANIEGTLESPNLLRGRASLRDAADADLGENIESEEKNGEDWSDQNRQNIHGATDSVIYKNLGIQEEDLRESQVQRVADFAPQQKKSLIHHRLGGEDFTNRGASNVDVSNTDLSALNDISVFKQEEQSQGKLSAFKSVPNHFSLVSGNQDASQNVTIDVEQNPFANRRQAEAEIDNGEVDHDHSIEQREGGAPTAGNMMTTNRLSTQEAVAVNDSSVSMTASKEAARAEAHEQSIMDSSKAAESQVEQENQAKENAGSGEADKEVLLARGAASIQDDAVSGSTGGRQSALLQVHNDPSGPKTMMKRASKQRRHTTIIEEEEKDTEFDRRQSQLASADAEANIGSALALSASQRPEEGAGSHAAESSQWPSADAHLNAGEAPGGPSESHMPHGSGQQDAKPAIAAAESGEQEIVDADSSHARTDQRPSVPKSMQSVPINGSSEASAENVGGQGDEEEGQLRKSSDNMNFMSANLKLSANTSQLTVDEQNHPVEKLDEMQFKINIVEAGAGDARHMADVKDGCTDCFQSRNAPSQRARGKEAADKEVREAPEKSQLRTSQTTEDNFKNVKILNNDLKMFKKAPENAQITDSKRQAEIQKIKMSANQHRQTLQMYSNSSMANMKNAIGNELVNNSSSSQNSRDRDRPKTAELDAGDEAKKKDDLTRISNTNALRNAKWISTYDHSNKDGFSKHANQSDPLARDSSAQKSVAAEQDDKNNELLSPERLRKAQEKRDSFKLNLLYNGSQGGEVESTMRNLVSKKQSQSIESRPEVSEHRDWFNKIKQDGEDQGQRPAQYAKAPAEHLHASASSPGGSGSAARRLMYLNQVQQANINQGTSPALSTTLRPMDIADPYNPRLVQRLGVRELTKSQAQSRSSQKRTAGGLIREAPRASVSQAAHLVPSNFSSAMKHRQPAKDSRQGSEQRSDAKQGPTELKSSGDQYDSTQIRVSVPKMQGDSRREMPFLNVKGKNTQAVQQYDKIMSRGLPSPSRKRSQDAVPTKGKRAVTRDQEAREGHQLKPERELERGRSQEQLGLADEGLRQRKMQRQQTSRSGNQPAKHGSQNDFLDQQMNLTQKPSKLSVRHEDCVPNLSSSKHNSRQNVQRSLRASDHNSRPQSSSYSRAPRPLKSGAPGAPVAQHHGALHHQGGGKDQGQCALKSSANLIIQGGASGRGGEKRDAAGAAGSRSPRGPPKPGSSTDQIDQLF